MGATGRGPGIFRAGRWLIPQSMFPAGAQLFQRLHQCAPGYWEQSTIHHKFVKAVASRWDKDLRNQERSLPKMDSESAVRIAKECVDARRLSKLVYCRWQMEPNNLSVSIRWLPLIFRVYRLADIELRFSQIYAMYCVMFPAWSHWSVAYTQKGYQHRHIGLIWHFWWVLLAPVVYYLWRYMCSFMAPDLKQKRTIS